MTRLTAYQPQPESPEDLALMRRIDELHLEMPYAGARMLIGCSNGKANQSAGSAYRP